MVVVRLVVGEHQVRGVVQLSPASSGECRLEEVLEYSAVVPVGLKVEVLSSAVTARHRRYLRPLAVFDFLRGQLHGQTDRGHVKYSTVRRAGR